MMWEANFKREAYYLEVSSEEWTYHQFFHFSLHDVGYVQKDSNLLNRRFIKKMLEDTGDDTLLMFVQKTDRFYAFPKQHKNF